MRSYWASEVTQETLILRDNLLRKIRNFFCERGVLEVTTPTIGIAGASDPHLENLTLNLGSQLGYMQTSPEYAMKRLVAGGSGPIYQICPAYRGGEAGKHHNIEFTMLEWYRPEYSLQELIFELQELLHAVCALRFKVISYGEAFQQFCNINVHGASLEDLKTLICQKGLDYSHLLGNVDISDYLDLIFSTAIERHLEATIVTDFPACQAALAETKSNNAGELVASRFECFLGGIELANGYFELRDTDEILNRLGQNNLYRRRNDLPQVPIDEMAVTAMGEMNPCSGVAVGIDRLVMYLSGETNITRVINFAGDHRLD
ncbi:MAG: EF-P lysine aminoacylase EpmA [Pseudomonadota bacterium]|nr:EF-P lysine aminoacylase EpmA [Pseudomonadota bacterium]